MNHFESDVSITVALFLPSPLQINKASDASSTAASSLNPVLNETGGSPVEKNGLRFVSRR